jgi:hypothetical protein
VFGADFSILVGRHQCSGGGPDAQQDKSSFEAGKRIRYSEIFDSDNIQSNDSDMYD